MRLGALPGVRDGHGGIYPLDSAHGRMLHLLPIRLYQFPEGIHVVAEIGRRELVGDRLVSIAGVPIAEAIRRVRPLVPSDNVWSRDARALEWLARHGGARRARPVGFRRPPEADLRDARRRPPHGSAQPRHPQQLGGSVPGLHPPAGRPRLAMATGAGLSRRAEPPVVHDPPGGRTRRVRRVQRHRLVRRARERARAARGTPHGRARGPRPAAEPRRQPLHVCAAARPAARAEREPAGTPLRPHRPLHVLGCGAAGNRDRSLDARDLRRRADRGLTEPLCRPDGAAPAGERLELPRGDQVLAEEHTARLDGLRSRPSSGRR